MPVLLLSRVDKETTNICQLRPGEHVIGRGVLLECNSKKVSRNHGLIRVTETGASLTSTHPNPCFYLSKCTQHMTIVKNGTTVPIQNEDQIALLPDEYWFKVQIIDITDTSTTPNNENMCNNTVTDTSLAVRSTQKRENTDDNNIINKRRKSNCVDSESSVQNSDLEVITHLNINPQPSTSTNVEENCDFEINANDFPEDCDFVVTRNSSPDVSANVQNENGGCESPDFLSNAFENEFEPCETVADSYHNNTTLQIGASSQDNTTVNKEHLTDDKISENKVDDDLDEDNSQLMTAVSEIEKSFVSDVELHGELIDGNISTTVETTNVGDCIHASVEERKDLTHEKCEENIDSDITFDENTTIKQEVTVKTEDESTDIAGTSGEDVKIKQEDVVVKKEKEEEVEADDNCDNDVTVKKEEKDEVLELSDEDKDLKKKCVDPNQPSTSGAPARRDRCWYGSACYRKNLQHKTDFSHPGDADYETDPDDDRPVCGFGATCFRKNPQHRRDFRHPARGGPVGGRPMGARPMGGIPTGGMPTGGIPFPAQPNPAGSTSTTPPRKRRKPNKKTKQTQSESEEDDYDYSDPFLDDGSSDEFTMTMESSDSDDDDVDDEEELEDSQERRQLIKEAKKFTKAKKK